MRALVHGAPCSLDLPPPAERVVPGVRWGAFDELFTPAFWAGRVWMQGAEQQAHVHRLGKSFAEEVAACLLGGYGIPAEVGLAAFERLRAAGLLARTPSSREVEAALDAPLQVGAGLARYRFARQKSGYLAGCLAALNAAPGLPEGDRELRGFLAELPGIGPKTASWITRNWRDSDAVAILDVHICRACILAGVFPSGSDPARDYFGLEARFLAFSEALGTRASMLDSVMWQVMRRLGPIAVRTRQPEPRSMTPRQSYAGPQLV